MAAPFRHPRRTLERRSRFATAPLLLACLLAISGGQANAQDDEFPAFQVDDGFRHFGDFLIRSRLKITGDKVTRVPIKPLRLSVSTDGVSIRISTEAADESWSTFTIYCSDGVGRISPGGPLEIIPGIQAISDGGGAHRHLRLTREALTLTVFPGISDQTVVTHATAAPAAP